ncbi:DUF2184 domain-containing protein [Pseudomonas sp. NPDC098747]|uniref:DUF2184 domain-containing protein n=1 Tax=Pseudomonas sp. NPDC098747 TaxID=3364487 RepID=UPI00383B7059
MSKLILPRHFKRARTVDNMLTFDAQTIDSSGVFLIGELERLDQTLHAPLVSVTWGRDIQLREDVSIADEVSSFTNSTFTAVGGTSPTGKAWIGNDSSAIASLALDINKTAKPLPLWGMELSWTLPELASAQKLGRPVDSQKFNAMKLKHNMDIDEQVYIGDTELGEEGLLNSSQVSNVSNAITGDWATATHDEILADVDDLLSSTWENAGFAVCPSEIRLPPKQFSMLVNRKVSDAGNISILEYLKQNSIANSINGRPANIQPLKWLTGRGTSGSHRMIAYTNDKDRVRFPLVPLQRTPLEYRGIRQITTYYGRLGVVEIVYSETIGYRDGI